MTTQDQQQPAPQWTHDDNPRGCWATVAEVWAPPFTDDALVAEDAAERIVRCLRECGEHELAEALR